MTKKSLLPLCLFLAMPGLGQAATVVYTIVNSSLNSLTLSGELNTTPPLPHSPQGGPGSVVDTYTGSITADLTAGVLTFTAGNAALTAAANPSAPPAGFLPAGSGIDNYAVTVHAAAGGGSIAFRDLVFDISGGTATHGAPTTATFALTAGKADYDAPAFGAGSLPLAGNSAANSSALPVSLVTVGDTETLTLPVTIVFPGNASTPGTTFTGQFVLERTIPEPTALALAAVGLAGLFRRRRSIG